MKKVLVVLGIFVILFGLFIWWGSTVESPILDEDIQNTIVELENQNFTSDKGNFSIYFETTPRYVPGTLTTLKGESYPTHLYQSSAVDGSVWQVLYTEYPKSYDVSNPENVLLNTVQGMETSVAGKITKTEIGEYRGFLSIDYMINVPEQKYIMKGRNILNGSKLYSMAYIYDEGKELPSDHFFDSLKISK
jgi:hypothetical protein